MLLMDLKRWDRDIMAEFCFVWNKSVKQNKGVTNIDFPI